MDKNVLQLGYNGEFYYIQYYPTDSVSDLKEFLVSHFNFDSKDLKLYCDEELLSPDQKVADINKNSNIRIVGNQVITPPPYEQKQDSNANERKPEEPRDRYRRMGFQEPDEVIDQCIAKYNGDVVKVLTELLKNQREPKKKSK